jgi:hypothetical protein
VNVQNCIAWVIHFLKLKAKQVARAEESEGQMVKPGADTWRMWLGIGLGGLDAVLALSIARNVMPIFLALVALTGDGFHTPCLVNGYSKERSLQVWLQSLPHCTTAFWYGE